MRSGAAPNPSLFEGSDRFVDRALYLDLARALHLYRALESQLADGLQLEDVSRTKSCHRRPDNVIKLTLFAPAMMLATNGGERTA